VNRPVRSAVDFFAARPSSSDAPRYSPSSARFFAVYTQARWGIGGGSVPLWKGRLREPGANHNVDRRTAVGIDTNRRLLWLAVFESASSAAVAQVLAKQGAQDGIVLDGGHSTSMVLGPHAAQDQAGSKLGAWRPVATFFGIRAEPLR
jgi:hypothetical protein